MNHQGKEGITAVYLAAQHGEETIVETLAKHGADVNAVEVDGFAPLHVCCQHGHLGTVEILLTHGANTNLQADTGKW